MWTFDSTRTDVTYDPRLLEDTTGSLAVSALTRSTAEGTTVGIRRQSARVFYRSTAGPPPSRGRPCAVPNATLPSHHSDSTGSSVRSGACTGGLDSIQRVELQRQRRWRFGDDYGDPDRQHFRKRQCSILNRGCDCFGVR